MKKLVFVVMVCGCHGQEAQSTEVAAPTNATTATVAAPSASAVASVAPSASAAEPVGDSFGEGGLGLAGVGEGAGGRGEGIGLGSIGDAGAGTGTGEGFGNGHGRLGPGHMTKVASIRQGSTTVVGRLPPEVIQRIVRQNFGRFRLCYEEGLRRDAHLAGTVATRFTIDQQGNPTNVTRDATTTLGDAAVVSCVTGGFSNLSFPQPEGGTVLVVFPVIFAPPPP